MPSGFFNFHFLRSWKLHFGVNCMEFALIYTLRHPCWVTGGLLAIAFHTIWLYCLETKYSVLYNKLNYYKDLYTQDKSFFTTPTNPIFIVDKDGNIIKSNKKGKDIIYSEGTKLCDGKSQNLFNNYVKKVAHDIINDIPLENNSIKCLNEKSYFVQAEKIEHKNQTYVKMNCIDVTSFQKEKKAFVKESEKQHEIVKKLYNDCVELFKNKESINSDIIRELFDFQQKLKSFLVLHDCLNASLKKEEYFNIHFESSSVIDLIYNKASDKDVSLIYTREISIPNCILGSKSLSLMILKTLIEFGINNSSSGKDLLFHVKFSDSFTEELGIEFQISFNNDLIDQEDINK